MFQNRIFREQWKKENIPQSVFLNEGGKKKKHKTSAGTLGCLHGFKESQFPNLPGQEP